MRYSALDNFNINNYTTTIDNFFDRVVKARPEGNFNINSNDTRMIKQLFIEEMDNSRAFLLTREEIKAFHIDLKKGVFVIHGTITGENQTLLNLIKESMKKKSESKFIKKISIIPQGQVIGDKINITEYTFNGYIQGFYESYDVYGNLEFDLVICKHSVTYRDNIYISRIGKYLAIGDLQEQVPVISSKGLQLNNSLLVGAGMFFAGIAMLGSAPLTIMGAITIVYGGNTLISGTYGLYLDYIGEDHRMNDNTLLNNPLRFAFGKIGKILINDLMKLKSNGELIGCNFYHGSEIALGIKGIVDFKKSFKVGYYIKNIKIHKNFKFLGELEGMEKVLDKSKVGYSATELYLGGKGIKDNYISLEPIN
ncbi:MAG: hypothetical protein ACRCRV_04035 [Cetobacterium sp.]